MASNVVKVFDPALLSDQEKLQLILKPATMYRGVPRSRGCPVTGCILWEMSTDGAGYPQMKLGAEFDSRFGKRPQSPVRILYSIYNNLTLNFPNFEMSHLCHTPLCIQTTHVSYEPQSINSRRNICRDNRKCSRDHVDDDCGITFPDCLHFYNC